MASSNGPAYRNGQKGMASSKRRTSFDTRLTICTQPCEGFSDFCMSGTCGGVLKHA